MLLMNIRNVLGELSICVKQLVKCIPLTNVFKVISVFHKRNVAALPDVITLVFISQYNSFDMNLIYQFSDLINYQRLYILMLSQIAVQFCAGGYIKFTLRNCLVTVNSTMTLMTTNKRRKTKNFSLPSNNYIVFCLPNKF